MVKKCVICEQEFDETEMIPIFTGRMKWKCWKCDKESTFQYNGFVNIENVRIARDKNVKK